MTATTLRSARPRATSVPSPGPDVGSKLFYRFEAQLDVRPVGLLPEGLRMTNGFEGRVTEGILARQGFEGARVWGIDHFVLRSDGVGVIDAQKTISAGEVHLLEQVRGYCLPPQGMEVPPLEEILSPGFQWPDTPFPIVGSSSFRVPGHLPELAHLNRAFARIDGEASFVTGRLVVETRLLEPRSELVGS